MQHHSSDESETASANNLYKTLFWSLVVLLLVGIVAGVAYWYGTQQGGKGNSPLQVPTVTPTAAPVGMSPTITESDVPVASVFPLEQGGQEQGAEVNIVPPGGNAVSFTRINGDVRLVYRNKVYLRPAESQGGRIDLVEGVNVANLSLVGLVNAPDFVAANQFMYDEVHDLIVAPNKKDFAFVMRWNPKVANGQDVVDSFYLYMYRPTATPQLTLLNKFASDQKFTGGYYAPVLVSFSSGDPTLLQVNLAGCWNCGGHPMATILVDTKTKAMKYIGRVIDFKWKEGRNYSWREYKEVPCAEDSMGPCLEKPENLNEQIGTF